MRLALLLLAAGLPLAAQSPVTCGANVPSTRTVRAEGRTELVADVVVTCTGGSPTGEFSTIPAVTFTLNFNANVTSRLLGAGGASEALLLLDEPLPGAQYACATPPCAAIGNGAGTGYYGPTGNFNVYEGAVAATGNALTWSGIPMDPPGSRQRVFRFTNIRLDPASLKTGGDLQLTTITVTAAAGGPTVIGGPLSVATPQTSLTTSVRDASGANAAPAGVPITLTPAASTTPTRAATLRFAMSYAGAELPRTIAAPPSPDAPPGPTDQNFPGAFYNSESGFRNSKFPVTTSGADLSQAGLADWGTRLMATFTNIPAGVTVYVSLRNDAIFEFNGPMARLTATDANGAGAFSAIAGDNTIAQLTPVNGTATAVWEVLRNADAIDQYNFGVYFTSAGGIYPAPSPINVAMRYAPSAGGIPIFSAAAAAQLLATFTTTVPPPPPPPVISASPAILTFNATAGGNNPPAQSVVVASSPSQLGYGVSGGGILPLRVTPGTGSTPDTAAVSINTQGTSPGTYRDTLTFSVGGASAQVAVILNVAPAPVITAISPASTPAGSPAFTLTVTGLNFAAGTAVTWNGAPLSTTVVSATQLTAQIAAALVAKAGTATVAAITADGSRSNGLPFTILPFSLTAIDPATVAAGGPAFTLTATGVGFLTGATLNVGGAAVQTTASGATSITATVPASAIAQPGTLPVTVVNPGGVVSNTLNLTVVTPLTLTAIAPATVTATHPAFALTLTGSGFSTGVTAQVGSTSLTPTSVSATSMTVTVPAEVVAQPGSLSVRVASGGLTSSPQTLTVNPPPHITSLAPATTAAGASGFTLTVNGTGLFAGSTIQWNGQALPTSGAGPTQLTAQVPTSLVAAAGSAPITVVTFDGVVSNAVTFTIGASATITGISPSTANVGAAAFTLTVTGTNFQQGATVLWSGVALPTTFVSATQLTAAVAANLLTSAGTVNVSVSNAGGATTGSLPFKIVLPPLTNVGFGAPPSSSSGQDQPVTLTLGGTYPVDLKVTVTLTFAPDNGLPDDPAIQFQNGSRTFTFTVPAGTPATIPPLIIKTGTVAGVITTTATFTAASGGDVTPSGVTPQRIQIGRAAPVISSMTCSRNATGFTVVIDGYTNTRETTQASFNFSAASGQSLGTTQLQVNTASLFSGWFGSGAGATVGGIFRYTQPFTVTGSATVSSITVQLGNSAGTSATASCQLQ